MTKTEKIGGLTFDAIKTFLVGLLLATAYTASFAAIYQGHWVLDRHESVVVLAAGGLASLSWSFVLRMRAIIHPGELPPSSESELPESRMPFLLLAYGLALFGFAWLTSLVMHIPYP